MARLDWDSAIVKFFLPECLSVSDEAHLNTIIKCRITGIKTNPPYLFTGKTLNKKKTKHYVCPGLTKNLNRDMSVHFQNNKKKHTYRDMSAEISAKESSPE